MNCIPRLRFGCLTLRTVLLGYLATAALAASASPIQAASAPSFSEEAFRKHVATLSSDAFEGRAPGTAGETKTLDYIEQQFRAAGLSPAINGSFRQAVPVVEMQPHADPSLEVTGAGGKSLSLKTLVDVVIRTRRPVADSQLKQVGIVYAGYGIVAPEYQWNDYAGLDVRGKLVLVLVNDPGYATQDPKLFTGNAMTYYGRWDYKYAEAVRQGAAGVLVIHETRAAGYPWDVARGGATNAQFDLRPDNPMAQRLALEGWITEDAAARLFALASLDFAQLKRDASRRGFHGRALGLHASGGVRNDVRQIVTYNVVGILPGAQRPNEAFIYTAHWDHLGKRRDAKPGEDAIYNGASDNATGVAGLIELARAFATTKPRPQRSVMFVAVTGEESGLLGSEYFAEHPPLPVARMAGGLNMDNLYAIGRTRDLTVIGYGASELDEDLRRAAATQGRVIRPEPTPEKGFYYRSDHFSLAKRGVPMLYTKAGIDSPTKGPDYGKRWLDDYIANRYHQPSDEYDPSWDVSGIMQDLAVYYDVGRAIADSTRWPNWRKNSEFRAIRDKSRAALSAAQH